MCKIMTPPKDQRRGVRNRGESLSRVTGQEYLVAVKNIDEHVRNFVEVRTN